MFTFFKTSSSATFLSIVHDVDHQYFFPCIFSSAYIGVLFYTSTDTFGGGCFKILAGIIRRARASKTVVDRDSQRSTDFLFSTLAAKMAQVMILNAVIKGYHEFKIAPPLSLPLKVVLYCSIFNNFLSQQFTWKEKYANLAFTEYHAFVR